MAEMSSGSGANEEAFEFDCPECGIHIKGEISNCPKCGVEFVIEEVTEVACPKCGRTIPADSAKCPHCGAEFEEVGAKPASEGPKAPEPEQIKPEPKDMVDEGALRRQFPDMVAEVKPLLTIAKEHGIDSSEGRRLIDKSVRSGKQKDIVSAVRYVKECRESIRAAIDSRLDREIQYLEKLVDVAKSLGSDPVSISEAIGRIKERRKEADLEGALRESQEGKKAAERLTGKYIEASELSDQLEKLIQSCERFYVDVREGRKLLSEARDAGEHGDWSMMGILARKGREEILKTLPDILNGELKKARSQLLDAKAEGKDISMLIKVLKEAGMAAKMERWEEALERLIEFKSEAKYV